VIAHNVIQLSPEWWALKRAVPSASSFDRILTPAKGEKSEQQIPYICELVGEILGDDYPPVMSEKPLNPTRPMDNGILQEPLARAWYAVETGLDVRQTGVCFTDDGRLCCSPDGVVAAPESHDPRTGAWKAGGVVGCVELKCPLAKTHAAYLLKGGLPREYKCQVHGQLVVTGAKWVDFMSYHEKMPPLLVRVTPDEFTEKLRAELARFVALYEEVLEQLGIPKPWGEKRG
jgi:hypothetical protein